MASRYSFIVSALLGLTGAGGLHPDAAPATWTIDPKPTFNVGAENEDTLDTFGEVIGAARLPDGNVVVADRKNFALRYFSPTGHFVRSVGRKGDGPGEFHIMRRVLHCGDSLFVMETGTGRWSVYSLAGTFARTFTLAMPVTGSPYPYESQCNRSGLVISRGWSRRTEQKPGNFRVAVPFWIARSDGAIMTRLGDLPGDDRFTTLDNSGRPGGDGPLPLGKQPVLGIGRNRAYVGTADSFAIDIYDFAGKRIGMMRKPRVDLRMTPADVARFWVNDTAGKADATKASIVRTLRDAEFPKLIPAYAALLVDSDDDVWVQAYPRAADKASRWTVFAPTGSEIADIDLPSNLTVTEVGRDYIVGIALELPDGVNHVKVFHLKRAATR